MRSRRAGVAARVLISSVLATAVVVPLGITNAAADTTVTLQPIRTIGQSGHAGLYAWGVAYDPTDNTVLVGDYWNFRVARFNTDGTSAGPDPVTDVNKGSANNEAKDPLLHQSPYGLAVDPTNGDFYFGDVDGGKTVDKYGHSGGSAILAFGVDGAGPNKFKYPSRVVVAPNRNVYVIDQWDHTISVHNPSTGQEIFAFGGSGSGNGQFKQPRGAALSAPTSQYPQGRLFVTDNYNQRVQVFDAATGAFLLKWGSKGDLPGQFGINADLRGLAIDNQHGWVYVADTATGYVNKYTLDGTYLSRMGGYASGPSQLVGGPREVAVDGDGNVWVGDMPGFRLVKFDSDGNYLLEVPNPKAPPPAGGLNQPRGVAVDSAGRVVVTDTHNWRVQVFGADGTPLDSWGHRGGGDYGFNYQRGVSVDRRSAAQTPNPDAIVVADTDNHKIKKYTRDGDFVWEVGGFGTSLKQFKNPHSLAVGRDGRIYVADTQNRRVVVLDENGTALYAFGSQGNGDGQFQFNRSVTIDPVDDSLWVSDSIRGVVQHFSNSGAFLGKFGSVGTANNQLQRAADVEVNGSHVFVADVDAHAIKIWKKDGTFVAVASGGGRALGQVLNPHGMDIAPDGTLYVVENTGERVTQFSIVETAPDTTPPVVTQTFPAANQKVPLPSVTLEGSATDDSGVQRVDVAIRNTTTGLYLRADASWGAFAWLPSTLGSPNQPTSSYSFAFNPPGVGSYTFQSRAVDLVGLISAVRPTRAFTVYDPSVPVDTTAPTVTQTSPLSGQTVPGPAVTLAGSATDDVAVAAVSIAVKNSSTGLWLRADSTWGSTLTWLPTALAAPGAKSTTYQFVFQSPAPGGYGFQVRSQDSSGNYSATKPFRSFIVS